MLKFKDYQKLQAENSAEKEKQHRAIAIEDLQNSLSVLREFQDTVIHLSTAQNATALLIDAALMQVAIIDSQIKELGGTGFTSIEDTAEFIYEITKK